MCPSSSSKTRRGPVTFKLVSNSHSIVCGAGSCITGDRHVYVEKAPESAWRYKTMSLTVATRLGSRPHVRTRNDQCREEEKS